MDPLDQSNRLVEAHFNIARFGNEMDAFDDFLQNISPPHSPAENVKIFLTKAVDVVNDDDDDNSVLSNDSDNEFLVKPKNRSRPEINRKHSGDLEKLFSAPHVGKAGVHGVGSTEGKLSSRETSSSSKKEERPSRDKSLTRASASSRRRRDELSVSEHANARRSSRNHELSGSEHLGSCTPGGSIDRRGAARKSNTSDLGLDSVVKVSRVSNGIPRSGSGVSISSVGKGDYLSTSRARRAFRKDKPDDNDSSGGKESLSRVLKKMPKAGSGVSLSSAGRGDDLSTGRRRASRKEQADDLELEVLKESGSRVSKTIPRSGSGVSLSSLARGDELSSSRHGRRASRKGKIEDSESSFIESGSRAPKPVHRSGSDVSQSLGGRSDDLSTSRHGRRASRNFKTEDVEMPQDKNPKTIPRSASGVSLSSACSMSERSRQPVRRSELLEPGQGVRNRSSSRRRQVQRPSLKEDDAGILGTRRSSKSSEADMSSAMRRTRSTADAVLMLRRDRLGSRVKDTLGPSSHMRRCESTADARLAGLSSTGKKGITKRDIDDIFSNKRMGLKTSTVSHTGNAQWNLTSMTADATPTMVKLVF